MPFKSEAQRRYLWANEPEIARDWTDTYGSKIHAADGGIMRLGYIHGGITHPDGRRGFPGGSGKEEGIGTTSSGGLSSGANYSGGNQGGQGGGNPHLNVSNQHAQNLNKQKQLQAEIERQRLEKEPDVFKQQSQFNPLDFIPFIGDKSLSGMAVRGIGKGIKSLGNLFKGSGWDSSMGPRKDMGYNPNRVNPFSAPDRGDGPYILPQYINDLYAQNVMEEDDLDIDTSTGNMEDWSHRFRVGNPYRQDKQGQLDPQITEMISKLYT